MGRIVAPARRRPAGAEDRLHQRTVVAVFLGTRPSAGYAVEVSGTEAGRQDADRGMERAHAQARQRFGAGHDLALAPRLDSEVRGRDHIPEGRPVTEPTSTGVDARLSSVLCYAGWWVTGIVFLFAERRAFRRPLPRRAIDRRVRRAVGGALPLRRRERDCLFHGGPDVPVGPDDRQRALAGRGRVVVDPAAENVAGGNLAVATGRRPGETDRRYVRKAAPRAAFACPFRKRYSVFGTSIFGTDFGFTVPLACLKLKLLLAMRVFAGVVSVTVITSPGMNGFGWR